MATKQLTTAAPATTMVTISDKTTVKRRNQSMGTWKVKASHGALSTSNPIREIIETMNLAENPKKKVIPLSIGDPTVFGNLKPCNEILSALQEVNNCGKYYGYQMAAGMEKARDAVADYHFRWTWNKVKRQDVILASGCSHAIDMSICVLAQSGQNILIPRPGFPLYKTLTSVYGIKFRQYNLIAEKNWSIDLKHLESLIDERTAAIIINNPSNPCGSVFSERHLLQILDLAERFCLPIIADEIYDKFVFSPEFYSKTDDKFQQCTDSSFVLVRETAKRSQSYSMNSSDDLENEEPPSTNESDAGNANCISYNKDSKVVANSEASTCFFDNDQSGRLKLIKDHARNGDADNQDESLTYVPFKALSTLSERVPILTCGGISKTCLIPGLRLGWIIINDRANIFDGVRNGLNGLTQRIMGPNSLVQAALHDILTNVPDSFYKQTMDFIFKNAKLCHERLKLVNGLQPHMPQGSMYLMVKFDAICFPDIDSDLDFTSKLMNEESVLVLPGKCFDFPNYFRICLTVPTNVMEEALIRISEFCERHYHCSEVNCNKSEPS